MHLSILIFYSGTVNCLSSNIFACSGVALMGQLLQRSSPRHLTIALLEALKNLAAAVEASADLHSQVLKHLLLDLRLFSRADVATQHYLLRYYAYLSKAGIPHNT
jgi:hypothetical protein